MPPDVEQSTVSGRVRRLSLDWNPMQISRLLVAPVVAATLLLGACAPSADPGPDPDVPQTLVIGSFRDFARGSLDPAVALPLSNSDAPLLAAIYGYLVSSDPVTGEPILEMAESLTASDDYVTWTLTLREGLVFTDGNPLDAEAVKFNFDRHGAPESGSYNRANMTGVVTTVVDDLTVEIELPAPNAHFDKIISGGVGFIASPTAVEADPVGFGVAPVGAGPFLVTSIVRDSETKLEKNPDYYLADEVALETLELRVIPDSTQLVNSLIAGEIDFMAAATRAIIDSGVAGGMVSSDYINNGQAAGFYFQAIDSPFADIRARQAVALALDIEALAQIASGDEAAQEMFNPDSPFYVEGLHPETNDPERAQELFDELAAEGTPLSFRILGYDFAPPTIYEAIQSQLQAYENVSVTIEQVPSQSFAEAVNTTKNYDLAVSGLPFADPEPLLYDLYHSKGYQNKSGYSDPELDELLEEARATVDLEHRVELYTEVQEILADATLWIKFAPVHAGWMYDPSVENVTVVGDSNVRYDRIVRG
jgi:peptide/nickel transport system substrate-binding protein